MAEPNLTQSEAESILREIYYDPKRGLAGAEKMYHKVKSIGIKRKWVDAFLKKQEINQINATPQLSGSFIAPYPLYEFQIDLIYLENKQLNQASYGLVCIDVFSKKADIELMKLKDEKNTVKAMSAILDRMGIPEVVYCDEGAEFNNAGFRRLMKTHDIELILTLRHAPFAERFNRTIKNMMQKYMVLSKSKTLTKVLPILLENYNNSYHKTIKMAPNEVTTENIPEVWHNIKNSSKTTYREPINVGDKVRVLIKERAHEKRYKGRFSKEVHTVIAKEGNQYRVNGLDRTYLRAYLMKVGDVETGTIEPVYDGTQEKFLRELAKRQTVNQNVPELKVEESIARTRPKRDRKTVDRLTY